MVEQAGPGGLEVPQSLYLRRRTRLYLASSIERSDARAARAEGYRLMEHERAEAMNERQAKLNALRDEVNRSVQEEKELIHRQAEEARQTLEADARNIAVEISSQILHRPVGGISPTGLGSGL